MYLEKSILIGNKTLEISGSKSISNRLLILKKLFENIIIENLSNSQDTQPVSYTHLDVYKRQVMDIPLPNF